MEVLTYEVKSIPREVRSIILTSLGLQSNLHIGDFEAVRAMSVAKGDEKAVEILDGMIEEAKERYRAADKWINSFKPE